MDRASANGDPERERRVARIAGIVVRRAAQIVGWLAFAGFELVVVLLVRILASLRSCGACGAVGPRNLTEWGSVILAAAVVLLLGAAVGMAASIAAEGLLRFADRVRHLRSRE